MSTLGTGDTGLGGVTFDQLGSVSATQSGSKVKVSGTLAHKGAWPEFSSIEADQTGYYLPLALTGPDGSYMGKTTLSNQWKTIPVAECSPERGGLVIAVKKGQKSFTFQTFASKADAEAKENGETVTVDLSGVTYVE